MVNVYQVSSDLVTSIEAASERALRPAFGQGHVSTVGTMKACSRSSAALRPDSGASRAVDRP